MAKSIHLQPAGSKWNLQGWLCKEYCKEWHHTPASPIASPPSTHLHLPPCSPRPQFSKLPVSKLVRRKDSWESLRRLVGDVQHPMLLLKKDQRIARSIFSFSSAATAASAFGGNKFWIHHVFYTWGFPHQIGWLCTLEYISHSFLLLLTRTLDITFLTKEGGSA